MALTPAVLARLHQRLDTFAVENPRMVDALARLLDAMWRHRSTPTRTGKNPLKRKKKSRRG